MKIKRKINLHLNLDPRYFSVKLYVRDVSVKLYVKNIFVYPIW